MTSKKTIFILLVIVLLIASLACWYYLYQKTVNSIISSQNVVKPSINQNFDTSLTTKSSLRFSSPKGGEELKVGESYQILWEAEDLSYTLIQLSYTTCHECHYIIDEIRGENSFFWTVPSLENIRISNFYYNAPVFYIELSNLSGTFKSKTFSIITDVSTPASIQLLSPNGGERWLKGDTVAIKWRTNDLTAGIGEVMIKLICEPADYYTDCQFLPIADAPNSGQYSWRVGLFEIAKQIDFKEGWYKINIELKDGYDNVWAEDTSDDLFYISLEE